MIYMQTLLALRTRLRSWVIDANGIRTASLIKAIDLLLVTAGSLRTLLWGSDVINDFLIAAGFLGYIAVRIGEWWKKS